jgi:Zn-dependent protease
MAWSVTIGRLGGTAVRIHITFLLFLAWIGFSAWQKEGPAAARDSVLFILALFACVLLHEFGHILMARRFGIETPQVTLLPIGGVASLQRMPEKPAQELAVAIAGPLVNVGIALVILLFLPRLDPDAAARLDDPHIGLLARLAAANIFLVLFNMIPAFPMDGGRVLRALLAMKLGQRRATRIAATIGQILAFGLGFLGLFGNPLLLFIAIFVYMAAAGEAQMTAFHDAARGLRVADAMETSFSAMPSGATLADAVDALLATPQQEFPIIDAFGKPMGLLLRRDILSGLKDRDRMSPIAEIMRSPVEAVPAASLLEPALDRLYGQEPQALSVIDRDGRLVGLLTRQNLAELMMIKTLRPDWRFERHASPGIVARTP